MNKARVEPVAACVPPAVEPGVSPGGLGADHFSVLVLVTRKSGRQDAALYGRRDARRHRDRR